MNHLLSAPFSTALKSQEGFTIIEVMVSAVIFSIGILGAITMQINAIKTNSLARDLTERSVASEEHIEYLLALPSDHELLKDTGTDPDTGALIYRDIIADSDGNIQVCQSSCSDGLAVITGNNNTKKIFMKISSVRYGKERSVEFETFKL